MRWLSDGGFLGGTGRGGWKLVVCLSLIPSHCLTQGPLWQLDGQARISSCGGRARATVENFRVGGTRGRWCGLILSGSDHSRAEWGLSVGNSGSWNRRSRGRGRGRWLSETSCQEAVRGAKRPSESPMSMVSILVLRLPRLMRDPGDLWYLSRPSRSRTQQRFRASAGQNLKWLVERDRFAGCLRSARGGS
ncbi:hypothetical protein OF83DRAFT_1106865 [Amylostereum chailletii]|nr:hypothetical protein OF83DRAFT_1106865 [Amylostereum chailletii]